MNLKSASLFVREVLVPPVSRVGGGGRRALGLEHDAPEPLGGRERLGDEGALWGRRFGGESHNLATVCPQPLQ